MLEAGLISIFPVLYFIIPLAPIAYVAIKWRIYREKAPDDPKLAIKVILFYFKTLAYQVILVGVVLAANSFIKEGYNDNTKTGLAIIISGLIIYGLHVLAIGKYCPVSKSDLAFRFYEGFNIIVIGLLATLSLTITLVMIFQGITSNIILPLIGLVVYGVSWAFRGLNFMNPKK